RRIGRMSASLIACRLSTSAGLNGSDCGTHSFITRLFGVVVHLLVDHEPLAGCWSQRCNLGQPQRVIVSVLRPYLEPEPLRRTSRQPVDDLIPAHNECDVPNMPCGVYQFANEFRLIPVIDSYGM